MTSRFRKHYSAEEDAVIRLEYPTVPSQELAERLGRTIRSLQARAFKLGVVKKVRSPNAGCFPKGLVPFNKGKRRDEWMSREMIEKCSRTQFKKGGIPPTARAVGHERVQNDGYVYVKVPSHRKMVLKHRYVWEQHNGPIPAGMAVAFKDGNPLNCDIANLELISRKELMRRNSYHTNYPEEVQRLIQLKGAINRQLNKKNKTSSTNKDYGTENSRD